MFLHLQVPGFHAAVHQAKHPSLRHRPVAVAMDAGLNAPLFATSPQARLQHIEPGMRADEALRRCPDLLVVPPDPQAYRHAQRQLSSICRDYGPRVGGTAGRIDLEVGSETGTTALRSRVQEAMPAQAPESILREVALAIRRRCAAELHLDGYLGGSARLLVARLAATLARAPHVADHGIVVIAIGDETAMTDLLPVGLFTDCQAHVRDLLGLCGIATIGQLRALSADALLGLVGPTGAAIYESLHGLSDELIPAATDPEPAVQAMCRCGPSGADPMTACAMIALLAREIGLQLRQRQLACSRLSLAVSWMETPKSMATARLSRPCSHDADLDDAGQRLFGKSRHRGTHAAQLHLSAGGLCTVETACASEVDPDAMRITTGGMQHTAQSPLCMTTTPTMIKSHSSS